MKVQSIRITACALTAATLLGAAPASAAKTYFVDQVVDYTSACPANDLFDDTTSLVSRMDADSWTGIKYIDGSAWATDFRESCSSTYGSSGHDDWNADSKAFSVFSGHGSTSTFHFGVKKDICSLDIDSQSRLGSMSGALGAVSMYISCDTLQLDSSGAPQSGGYQWLRQQLGFHEITGNQESRYGSFFDDTSSKANSQAWLERMSDQPASVVSYANGSGDCWNVSSGAKLKGGVYRTPRTSGPSCNGGQPLYTWCSQWVGTL
jgi:hypothetical protein